jgi:hypothetical protein
MHFSKCINVSGSHILNTRIAASMFADELLMNALLVSGCSNYKFLIFVTCGTFKLDTSVTQIEDFNPT